MSKLLIGSAAATGQPRCMEQFFYLFHASGVPGFISIGRVQGGENPAFRDMR